MDKIKILKDLVSAFGISGFDGGADKRKDPRIVPY
jgi:hypothetical protein